MVQLYNMERLVIDTSALLAVLLNEPSRALLIRAAEGYDLVGAPSLPWEVGNALIAGFRRRRMSAPQVHQAWASYEAVPVRLAEIDTERALKIALDTGLYAYDAYVLEAARAERLLLLTLDRALERTARRLGLRIREVQE
jgi:predicted nucleic acid-binding protein